MTKLEVISRLLPKAVELNELHGLHVSMTLAQVMHESGWLAHAPGNNFLGIKWTAGLPLDRRQLLWTTEYINGKWVKVQCWFMTYPTLEDCMDRYAKILLLPRYKQTLGSKDWWDATNYIRLNGYAISPAYSDSLRNVILSNKLYEYDWIHAYNEDIIPGGNFTWGETFSAVKYKGKYYKRVIEPYPEYFDNVKGIAVLLQILRYATGSYPIRIASWFRIRDYNSSEDGAADSQHLYANAADPHKSYKVKMGDFVNEAKKTDATGIGIGNGWLHLDKKKNIARRIWYY